MSSRKKRAVKRKDKGRFGGRVVDYFFRLGFRFWVPISIQSQTVPNSGFAARFSNLGWGCICLLIGFRFGGLGFRFGGVCSVLGDRKDLIYFGYVCVTKMAQTEEGAVYERLLPRLFARDRYPSKQHNCNSSLEYLLLVRSVLKGTDEMKQLLGSCFGHLFRLPVRGCDFSAKVVHEMLTMQVVTKKRFEFWPVFGGQPMRFSLAEFGYVTGEFEAGYVVDAYMCTFILVAFVCFLCWIGAKIEFKFS